MSIDRIRNFCIIAHIDHGKSTLADRLLEKTRTIPERQMVEQVLDNMDLERERGITIKSHPIQMRYTAKDGNEYIFNLIDTPGHVDFSYEVSRALAASEGAILVVDATQGVEAQTISNLYMAVDAGLEIIPVINKIDLPAAKTMIETVKAQIIDLLGCREDEILLVSAKTGYGVDELLEAIVQRIPPPKGNPEDPLRALIFDSKYDSYRGVVVYLRVFDGELKEGDKIMFFANGKVFEAEEVGILKLDRIRTGKLTTGMVGYLIAGVKDVHDTRVGDTITTANNPAKEPLPGYREVKPMVYAGFYPADSENYQELRDALEKLRLNDAAIVFVNNPTAMPSPGEIDHIEEPYVRAQIITPSEYIGALMKLCTDRRGVYKTTHYVSADRAILEYELPLSEIIFDFYDKLKSVSRGYASFDYEFLDYRESDLVKLDILLNGEPVDALSFVVHRSKAYDYGRKLCSKLRELIPRQLFEVVIQAAIGSKVIARDVIKPLRKNVLAKCYGGDVTRKRKLLEKQKEGKKRMKQIGKVEVPQEAFLAVLTIDND